MFLLSLSVTIMSFSVLSMLYPVKPKVSGKTCLCVSNLGIIIERTLPLLFAYYLCHYSTFHVVHCLTFSILTDFLRLIWSPHSDHIWSSYHVPIHSHSTLRMEVFSLNTMYAHHLKLVRLA